MIIDFHAHIYPAKIAEKASDTIGQFYNIQMKYKGSPESLLESGSQIGVDRYIVHSTATAPHQVESINNYIIGEVAAHPEFIGFGTIHPEYENYENELIRIYSAGLMGIKLHPDFQKFPIDLREMDDIYEVIAGLKMPILVHAGDYRYDYSGPKRIAHVLEKHPTLKVVAAHFGGYTQWEDSEKYLVGKNVWFDTSSSLWKLTPDEAMRMIRNHGVEKMLFGVDYPMWDHQEELERFNRLPLTQEEREAILYKNAVDLLGL
ncbi:MAG: amidohydrolase family protein [Paludibacteraceae bacterium]|nr:amidohydrolase family protein [Paludibacteraceae bacterium]